MKKLLSVLVIGVVAIALPMSAKALDLSFNCEKSCRNEETGVCEQRCDLSLTNVSEGDNLSAVNPTFTITGDADKVTLGSLTAANENVLAEASRTGDVINMNFTILSNTSTNGTVELGTLVLQLEDNAVDCSGHFSLNNVTYEVEVDTTTEVETGATLPIAILACGVAAGAVIYIVTKKNKKLYKI